MVCNIFLSKILKNEQKKKTSNESSPNLFVYKIISVCNSKVILTFAEFIDFRMVLLMRNVEYRATHRKSSDKITIQMNKATVNTLLIGLVAYFSRVLCMQKGHTRSKTFAMNGI